MYVAMHFAAAAQVLLWLNCSFQLLAISFQPGLAGGNDVRSTKDALKADG
jgi:hypothetical protein